MIFFQQLSDADSHFSGDYFKNHPQTDTDKDGKQIFSEAAPQTQPGLRLIDGCRIAIVD